MNIQSKFSDKVINLNASAIREIFKLIGKPGIISFAGGAPAAEGFPANRLSDISKQILRDRGGVALQYGITEGYAPLREWVKERLAEQEIGGDYDETVIVSGGQQGIDLAAHSLINAGDVVICEEPSFIGGLNAFRSYNAEICGAPIEPDGIDVVAVENILKQKKNVKFIYTIPTFQNPTGITMSLEKRKKLLSLAKEYDVMIMEDNPYGELRFEGEDIPTIKSMDTEGRVIYIGSFSKILSPGLRVGFVCADASLVDRMVVCKQTSDVHTNVFAQMLVHEFVTQYSIDEHIENLCGLYGKRCRKMIKCIKNYFPNEVTFTRPQGGLFIFCTMPDGVDSREIMERALKKNVAFVPGATTMIDDKAVYSTFRLNYSNMSSEKIELGIKMLGNVLWNEI
ncbi:MAG: PLP-dependent aminotransferase family protein [Oscillospiraceae bacterium]|nr:PLP-dependent aminotransferase family protein [Oscillospiraceae bacterium]